MRERGSKKKQTHEKASRIPFFRSREPRLFGGWSSRHAAGNLVVALAGLLGIYQVPTPPRPKRMHIILDAYYHISFHF